MCSWWSELLQSFVLDNFPQPVRALCSGILCSCHPKEKKKCKNNCRQCSIQQDEVNSLTQRGKTEFYYQMPLLSNFCVNAEYTSTPKLWNALMKKQYITFTRSSYTGPGISLTCLFLLSTLFRFSFRQLFFISVLVYAISCHYSETGMVTGLKGQKEMYVICIFLKHTI